MHHVEASPGKNVTANNKASCGEVEIFHNIAKERFQLNENQIHSIHIRKRCLLKQLECWQPVNLDPIQDLMSGLAPSPQRNY
jgi:hypothetical protein